MTTSSDPTSSGIGGVGLGSTVSATSTTSSAYAASVYLNAPSGVTTIGGLVNLPGSGPVIGAIIEGIELQILDDLKRHEANLEQQIQQDRQDAADNDS